MNLSIRQSLLFYVLLVFLSAAFLYRMTVSYLYFSDDLQYTLIVESSVKDSWFYHPTGDREYVPQSEVESVPGEAGSSRVNPRYLLEWPTSILAANIWQTLGWDGSVIVPIQAIRIFAGALGLVFFFLALNNLVDDTRIALLCTAGLGIGAAYWTYSVHVDQSINMVTLLSLAFYLLTIQYRNGFSWRGKFIIAVVLAFASFYNFTAVLTTLAFAIGIALLKPEATLGERIREFVVFCAIYGLIVVLGIAAAVIIFVSPASLTDMTFWNSVLFQGKPEYNVSIFTDALRSGISLAKSQVLYPGVVDGFQDYFDAIGTGERIALLSFFGITLAILLLPFAYLFVRRGHSGRQATLSLMIVLWFAFHALFNWFWDPGFNKYWLLPLLCCWAMAGLALSHLRNTSIRTFRVAQGSTLVLIVLMFLINLTTQFLPESQEENSPWINASTVLADESNPNDLFISGGYPLDFHIAYFARRDILSLSLIAYDSGGSTFSLVDMINARIEEHRADNGKVYVYNIDELATEQPDIKTWLDSLELREAWTFPNFTVYEVVSS